VKEATRASAEHRLREVTTTQHPKTAAIANVAQGEHVEEDPEPRDGEVDLYGVEGGGVLTLEEVGRCDERACAAKDAKPWKPWLMLSRIAA